MMKLLRKLLKKSHRRPSTEAPIKEAPNIPEGQLGTYAENVQQLKNVFKGCNDIKLRELQPGTLTNGTIFMVYVESLSKIDALEHGISFMHSLVQPPKNLRPNETTGSMEARKLPDFKSVVEWVLEGWSVYCLPNGEVYAVNTYLPPQRSIERSETEGIILGPQEAFNESIQTNLSIIRRRIKSTDLKVKAYKVGKYSQNWVAIVYMNHLAQSEYVQTLEERVQAINIDLIMDSGDLAQMIDDNPNSPFPQYHMTERPERIASHLLDGKVAVFVDGTPFVLSGPASFIEFFQTSEDYANRWAAASVIRTLRIVGVLISISLSALYVAVVTYHYQMIPTDMLISLTESRARVPFPPVLETMIMELTIELLREAGARLPAKTGQTIGIVGGIVIGQAAVSAGFASNILIISVALSTVASFITPSYIMSSALRAIRFGLIMLAGFWGLYGLFIGLLMMVLHFLRLTSMGAPYFSPFAPLRISDWKDTLIRAPLPFMKYRPTNTRPKDTDRQPFKKEATKRSIPTSATVDSEKGESE
ncbi:spore germination protein [Tumebacillus sp. DT12]|uniref:Spore germination protein n=1 Tax=Tumebacillus lacus TaxID=2995335 RepID=A0ABT3X1S8_9BACL|nr:spore germination protein [Tumebacillus lacus]MCX7569571.1 spore germination protein [Tumebacillus lacus]